MKIKKAYIGLIFIGISTVLGYSQYFVSREYYWIILSLLILLVLFAGGLYIYLYKTQKKEIKLMMKPKYLFSFSLFLVCILGLSTILLIITLTFMDLIPYPKTVCALIVIFSYLTIYLLSIQYKALSDHEIKIEELISQKCKDSLD